MVILVVMLLSVIVQTGNFMLIFMLFYVRCDTFLMRRYPYLFNHNEDLR